MNYNTKRKKGKHLSEVERGKFFEKEDDSFPAKDFILSQNVKMRAKLLRMLELLELK